MSKYILRRSVHAIPILLGVSAITFFLMHVTGDPIELRYGGDPRPERIAEMEAMRRQLGLDRPVHIQYISFLADLVRGDLGQSLVTRRPVIVMIWERIPSTLELGIASLVLGLVIAIPVGIISATRRNTFIDDITMVGALAGVAIPNFWLGLILILVFSLFLGWLPATGSGTLDRLILPAIALGTGQTAVAARLVRSSLLEVMGEDYLRTAAAKGLSSRAVLYRHALRNAMIPVVTVMGLQIGQLLGGAVIIETVFARAGLGSLMIDSIFNRDYPVVQGVVLVIAFTVVLANLLVDVLYSLIDPRIKMQ